MAAGLNYKFAMTSGTKIDLTDPDVNPSAAPESTPRQGGFSLRNRINFTNVATANKTTFTVNASSSASQVANRLRVLSVPKRTVVKGPIRVFAVESQTIPGHTTAGTAATAASLNSACAAGVLGFTGEAYNDPSQTAASIVLNVTAMQGGTTTNPGAALGAIPLIKADAASDTAFEASQVEAVDSSMTAPHLGMVMHAAGGAVGTGSAVYRAVDLYFPHGGFVTMGMGPSGQALGAMASSKGAAEAVGLSGTCTGTWEIQADCMYVPE